MSTATSGDVCDYYGIYELLQLHHMTQMSCILFCYKVQWSRYWGTAIFLNNSVFKLLTALNKNNHFQGMPSSVTLKFKDFSRTFLRQPCTFRKIFHIQYTASLHAVIFTMQQNHYRT